MNFMQVVWQIFQLTRSRGAWHFKNVIFRSHKIFQLTRSRGAWLEYSDSRGQTGNFNSHAHVERDVFVLPITMGSAYFNSHAHVERDLILIDKRLQIEISTHTLTWSVTISSPCKIVSEIISTHTLTWSVTCYLSLTFYHLLRFQLTRSRGAWQYTSAVFTNLDRFQLTRSRGAWPWRVYGM